MKRKFINDNGLDDEPEVLDIKADLTGGVYPIYGDGLYITKDWGDGRVKIDELDSSSGEDVWYEKGIFSEYYEGEE